MVILNRMCSILGEFVVEIVEKFVKYLYDIWGVGYFGCDDGVLFFFLFDDW